MNIDLRSLGTHLAAVSRVTIRSFRRTILVAAFAGGVLAGLSYYFLRDHHWAYGVTAAVVALAEAAAVGVVLGVKRAAAAAVMYAFGTLRVGGSLVRVVFERILGVRAEDGGMRIVQGLAPVPADQADQMLTGAVRGVTADEHGGFVRRATQGRLLEAVRQFTQERIRVDGAAGHGGVDLLALKEKLERTVDDGLVKKVRGEIRWATAVAAVGLPLLVAAQTWLVLLLLQPKE